MSIISIIEQQVPSYIRNDTNDVFSRFLTEYYKFLSSVDTITLDDISDMSIGLLQKENAFTIRPEKGGVYRQLSSLRSFRDIETTPTSMVSNFVSEYMDGLNAVSLESIRNNISLMKSFYESKGNEKSFHFLFKMLYDAVVEVSYPQDKMLSLSDASWIDRTFIRVSVDDVTTELLDKSIDTPLANGLLKSYYYDVINSTDLTRQKEYYKLNIENMTQDFTGTSVTFLAGTTDEISVNVLSGLGHIDMWVGGYGATNLYPSDTISVVNEASADPNVQFGAKVEIESLKKLTLDDVTFTVNGSQQGRVEMVNDYFTVYEYDLESGNTITDLTLQGITSEATADIVFKDGDKIRVENIQGTFLSDYQLNDNGSGEYVSLLSSGTEVGSIRIRREYTACDSPATLVISGGTVDVVYPGKGYIFTPYVKSNTISISGLGVLDRDSDNKTIGLKITDMGIGYADSQGVHPSSGQLYNIDYKILVNGVGNSVGHGTTGKVGTEKYMESELNTLDGGAKLRDSNYYQEFSYEVSSSIPMEVWSAPVKKLIHPAGMKVFGREKVTSTPFDLSPTVDQFPAWSELFTNPESTINVDVEFSYDINTVVNHSIVYTSSVNTGIENSMMTTYSTSSTGIGLLDSIVSYGDINSQIFFQESSASFQVEASIESLTSVTNVEYHEESITDQPIVASVSQSYNSLNYNTHSASYSSILKGKEVTGEQYIGRNITYHDQSLSDSLVSDGSGSGLNGMNTLVYNIGHESEMGGEGIGGSSIGSSNILVHQREGDGGIGGSGSGSGLGGGNVGVFSHIIDTGTSSIEGSGSGSGVSGSTIHSYNPYSVSPSGAM